MSGGLTLTSASASASVPATIPATIPILHGHDARKSFGGITFEAIPAVGPCDAGLMTADGQYVWDTHSRTYKRLTGQEV